MYSLHIRGVCLGLLALVAACGEAPEYRFGQNITGIQFEFFDRNEGIHPSEVTLDNPRNPFREVSVGEDTKFSILTDGGNAGAFYAWAAILANIPTGEHQYYTATKLRDIFLANEVAPEKHETVRQMAIDAFQRVLDCFPESVFFDVTGTFPRRLAPLAYQEILEIGGVPQGDWVYVIDANGQPQVIRSTGFSNVEREFLCF